MRTYLKTAITLIAIGVCIGMVAWFGFLGVAQVPAPRNNSDPTNPKRDLTQSRQEIDARFPLTDYDEPEPANAEEKAKRWKKNKHYDAGNMVTKNPSNAGTATIFESHAFFSLPALPVAQSDVVLTGVVLNSEAHLSNDKTGVYSEFNVQAGDVLKGPSSTFSQVNLIKLSRPGGKVRYPSGHVERYEVMDQRMPSIGKRYLFFLQAIPETEDYEILTAYEVGSDTVQPLDIGQFDSFRGKNVVEFISTVRDAIAKN